MDEMRGEFIERQQPQRSTNISISEKWLFKLRQRQTWFRKAKNEIIELEHHKLRSIDSPFGKNGTFKILQLD